MGKLLAFLGATVGGAIGWWLGAQVSTMTAFIISVVGTAVGVYAGRRVAGSLLSIGVVLSGTLTAGPGADALPPAPADSVVQTTYRSDILGQERELIIHLPRGYDPTRRYPVLYVLDGSSQDQPLADKLDSLSRVKVVPQTIVVGIPNMSGSNRTFQLVPPFMRTDPANPESPKGTADRFLEFMEKELIPFIATRYGASDTRLFAGNSRGGLLVMYSLIKTPALFAGRFCFSTPLWRENNLLVERVSAFLAGRTALKSFLYLSAGENETEDIKGGLDAMAAVLKQRAPAGLVWQVERTPGVDHSLNAQVSGWSALKHWGEFVLGVSRAGTAQARPCTGIAPDSVWLRSGPVYRDCEVEQPAKRRGDAPRLELDPVRLGPDSACKRVTLVFVVDARGAVELPSVRTTLSDHPELEAAVRATLPQLKYAPARRENRPVRQVVEYSRSVATPQVAPFAVKIIDHPTDRFRADPPRPPLKGC